jgi:hypothetical protein
MSFQFSLYDALVGIDVPVDKARAVVDALERDMGATLATKQDVLLLRQELKQELDLLRKEVEHLRQDVARDMELLRSNMTVRLGSIQVVTAGLLFAALKLT